MNFENWPIPSSRGLQREKIAPTVDSAQDSFFFQERVSHLSRMEARELGVVTSGTFFTKHVAMFPPNAICLVGKDVI
jgi:hypothetical protein